jgi:nitrogen-specific signal transduction histidine kinase
MPELPDARAAKPAANETKFAAPEPGPNGPGAAARTLPGLTQRDFPRWIDLLLILFLVGLAVLPPIREIHKHLILLAIAIVQLAEGKLIRAYPRRGRYYAVLLKLALASLLIDHTGEEVTFESSYYPIYYLPVMTAAMYFGTAATMFWTLLASGAYCSYLLYPLSQGYTFNEEAFTLITIRILFFFFVAIVMNRFSIELRLQSSRYQALADRLSITNARLEQAQEEARRSERLAALGQLSAGLAHEIRNPLGVIKGSAELLMQKVQNASPLAAELAGYISSEVNRLGSLVARFLDFARPLRAERRFGDIGQLLDRVFASVASHWQGGPVVVEKNYEGNLPMVPLDENLCEQAFLNLVQNAYEAMGDVGGTLRASIARARWGGRAGVEVRLEDTGPGVPADLREQIFNPFVTTKKTGVGLGLSIVSQIMDGHRGSIHLESHDGHGARFVLFFPAEPAPATKEPATAGR